MKPREFTRRLGRKGCAGFTLTKMLVTMLIASVSVTMMTGYFRANAEVQNNMSARSEAQQGVPALLEMVTRELR